MKLFRIVGACIAAGMLFGCASPADDRRPAARAGSDSQTATSTGGNLRSDPCPGLGRSHGGGSVDSDLAQEIVGDRLEQLYGANTKTDLDAQLSRGLIGTTLDFGDPAVVVVVDPGLIAVEKLQADLGEAIASGSNGQDTLPVRVQAGCYSSAELLLAGRIIRARDWHPAVEKVS